MSQDQVDLFFREVDRHFRKPAEIILTGAMAGALMGHVRPSLDIDFEIRAEKKDDHEINAQLEQIINETAKKLNIAVNYSEDIGHWSMISFLDYREHAILYKKIGSLKVKILAPDYWTIGKMGRFLAIDIQDMIKVIKRKKIKSENLIALWAKALRSSPLSPAKGRFRDNVVFFLKEHGKVIWGKNFNPGEAIKRFHFYAGIR